MDYATYHLLREPETTIDEMIFLTAWNMNFCLGRRNLADGYGGRIVPW